MRSSVDCHLSIPGERKHSFILIQQMNKIHTSFVKRNFDKILKQAKIANSFLMIIYVGCRQIYFPRNIFSSTTDLLSALLQQRQIITCKMLKFEVKWSI